MARFKFSTCFIVLLFGATLASSQTRNATLVGTVTDQNGQILEMVNVALLNFPTIGTSTNKKGEFLLRVPANRDVEVVFSSMGFERLERTVNLTSEEKFELNVSLSEKAKQLETVTVTDNRQTSGNTTRLDPSKVDAIVGAGMGSVESLIKTKAGVVSGNELTNQYSVRGGNFDENLVYVNDIEVYRPFLIRSGQQEGMSFVNSDMVSSIEFSAGGFDAKYGDKMSSVLDIRYSRPSEFKASAAASLLGATLHAEDISKNGKFTYNIGARYKSFQYLYGTLEEGGEYFPKFLDLQAYLTYQISPKLELGLLGSTSNNKYQFIPQSRSTEFGTFQSPLELNIYFDGQEIDRYNTHTGALSLNFQPTRNLFLKLIASAYTTHEEETYDIVGYYYFNELGKDPGSEEYGDSALNLGIGMYHEHARNFLDAQVVSYAHKGGWKSGTNFMQWGTTVKNELVKDRMNEWEYRDSAGYSLPFNPNDVELYKSAKTNYSHRENRFTAFFQNSYTFDDSGFMLTAGVRAHYWSFTDQLSVSPRFSASLKAGEERDVIYRLSMGWYHQPAFYREIKDISGAINHNIQTPRSFQLVAGTDYSFVAWDRPFKLTSEVYYKKLSNLIPYQYENVRIRYLAFKESKGYARGIDFNINGEFVSGTQSWASISLMDTKEDILNDGHGSVARPTDQRFKFSMYFQDYIPGHPEYQMHLTGHFITGAPYGAPKSERWQQVGRMDPYKRIDIGFLRMLVANGKNMTNWKPLSAFKSLSAGIEVFNMIDEKNPSSHTWVSDYNNIYYPVPNYLTGRLFNLKLNAKF